MNNIQNEIFYNKVIELFQNAKKNLSTAVNMTMVYSYYEAGRMIVEEEQGGKERAAYGKYILKELSQRLTQKFGRGRPCPRQGRHEGAGQDAVPRRAAAPENL